MTNALFLDRFLLALCVWREARGESLLGKQLVAEVIRNRVADPRWPNTFRDVILQPKQFSAFNQGDPNVVLFPHPDDPQWIFCLGVADVALEPTSPHLTPATHYHTTAVMPTWADDSKIVAVEGHHVFYDL